MAEYEGVEIPNELLEKVAGGGFLTPQDWDKYFAGIAKMKLAGISKERCIELLRPTNPLYQREFLAIVDEVYGS